jgi:Nucleotide modification associated domain 3
VKIILSRKGFDSSAGGIPSPILPDGRLLSLPIPHRAAGPPTYAEIDAFGRSAAAVLRDLCPSRRWTNCPAHLDPDLRADAVPRGAGWRPLFGQTGAAQGHLRRHGIGTGDLFLFFGWFRQTRWERGRLAYVPKAPDLHVIFGWLEVGRVWPVGGRSLPAYARTHPHAVTDYGPANTIYAARGPNARLGAGAFSHFHPRLQLSGPGNRRSIWSLPGWFYPTPSRPPLSYHGALGRWARAGDTATLATVPKGQEFVLDTACYPEAIPWVDSILAADGHGQHRPVAAGSVGRIRGC